jgi:Holliday junction DNA helicase RuvB
MNQRIIESTFSKRDVPFELSLRPQKLQEFIGQDSICKRLNISIGAALKRNESLSHCLFFGPPGLGKTTLASILAKAMGSNLVTTSGPAIEKPADLAGVLTNLQEKDVLFIDEIHRLNRSVEEYLYAAMEDFVLDLMIDSGPNARSVRLKLKPFTLAGATTRQGLLSSPLRSRFTLTLRLDYYEPISLKQIVLRTSKHLKYTLEEEAAYEIASRARGTPRIANNLLRWVRDYSEMERSGKGDLESVREALDKLSIDAAGLDEMDRKIIEAIIDQFEGGPVGLKALAMAVGEEENTIEEVYEPYLILLGMIKRTPRGREATVKAYQHLNKGDPTC